MLFWNPNILICIIERKSHCHPSYIISVNEPKQYPFVRLVLIIQYRIPHYSQAFTSARVSIVNFISTVLGFTRHPSLSQKIATVKVVFSPLKYVSCCNNITAIEALDVNLFYNSYYCYTVVIRIVYFDKRRLLRTLKLIVCPQVYCMHFLLSLELLCIYSYS
ncbi:hypothetical protein D1872_267810 [compost metagenome]